MKLELAVAFTLLISVVDPSEVKALVAFSKQTAFAATILTSLEIYRTFFHFFLQGDVKFFVFVSLLLQVMNYVSFYSASVLMSD